MRVEGQQLVRSCDKTIKSKRGTGIYSSVIEHLSSICERRTEGEGKAASRKGLTSGSESQLGVGGPGRGRWKGSGENECGKEARAAPSSVPAARERRWPGALVRLLPVPLGCLLMLAGRYAPSICKSQNPRLRIGGRPETK